MFEAQAEFLWLISIPTGVILLKAREKLELRKILRDPESRSITEAHNEVLFSLKKEGNSYPCYSTDEPGDIMLSEISESQKDKQHTTLPV